MNLFAPLAGLLGLQVEALTEKVKRALIVNAIVAVFGIIAATFLLVAGYLALSQVVGPIYAALYFGAGALVIAVAVFFISKLGADAKKHREAERRRSSESTALITTAAISALPMLLKSPLARAVGLPLAAVAAFFILGKSGPDRGDGL